MQAGEKIGRLLGDLVPTAILFLLSLTVLAWLIFRIRARFRDHTDSTEEQTQMLAQFADLYREGGLSQEEYRSIKGRMRHDFDDTARRSGTDV